MGGTATPMRIVIAGATSAMARAYTRRCAERGDALVLVGRNEQELARCASDALAQGAHEAHAIVVDATDAGSIDQLPGRVRDALLHDEGIALDAVVIFLGAMHDQAEAAGEGEQGFAKARQMAQVNYIAPMHITQSLLLLLCAPGGSIAVVSSVAGDRGRPSNFLYGSTKAGIDAYLEGLRAQQFKRGVAVTTIKPGFVDTAMTWGLDGMFLVASPEKVAKDIGRAIDKRRSVVYSPWFWRWIMTIIKHIPGPVFRRINL